ncbi:MAG: beta-ketoacyl-[acyl-carrier-protein] synthase family protein, partial [Phycisphaerae bacterium]|nr:beta-ketoacyl-[acyl-carrier-protein] synthase family protein [Phycisphaerae bacterium]
MTQKRVVITGMGTVNPLGHSVEATWEALLAGKTGISKTEIFDASTYPTTFSAQVRNFDLADHVDDAEKHRHAGRHCTFAIAAAVQAWKQSGLGQYDKLDRDRLGIYLGSGEGSLDFDNFISLVVDAWNEDDTLNAPEWGRLGFERMNMYREIEQESHMVVSHLAAEFGARGPAFNVLTACAASTQALGEAVCMIRRGEADAIISGGAHSMIHPLGVMGFNRLTALSVRNDDFETASRPFDATRDGFVLGEGASILILEDYDKVVERGAEDCILAEVMGYGSSADAFRITDQDPLGDGAAASMRAALTDAKMDPTQIDYISAHGTGTKQNDQVETLAMK